MLAAGSNQGLVVFSKEVQIVYSLFLVNCYLLHVPRLPSFPANQQRERLSDFVQLEVLNDSTKEVQIIYRLVNCYLLHVPRLPSQPASSGGG